ncbi:SRPBCC family protein [Ferruginibacter lapsinanis]|uniref:SRPBCC family protein n=1 Tax=Ferruginibacter lapsinanis TaxID=563172 RepID=UPI001E4A00F8|nr:SRPBCC family protein [Ferruginibacter lapsinanis]UEG49950.1 SRPBCC family protein [Ferruginibacter lapsinanis]
MRVIKPFFIGIIGLFIFSTLLSLLIPSSVKVSRTVIVNDTVSKVYAQVSDFHNWNNWHPMFVSKDVSVNFLNNGCDVVYNNKTTHLIFQSADSTSIKFLLKAEGENDISNEIIVQSVPQQKVTQVEWRAVTKLHWYPWEKFYAIFIDKMTGPGYEAALNGLKTFMETAH